MGLKFKRKKERHLLLSLIYRLNKMMPFPTKKKFKLFLDLAWIFHRLAHEASFRYYKEESHPIRNKEQDFLLQEIKPTDRVLDLGCKHGYISSIIADKAKLVVGIDYDAVAIANAQNAHSKNNLKFIVGDANKHLEETNERYEVLILSHVIEHLDEPFKLLKQIAPLFERIYIEVPDYQASLLNEYRKDLNVKLQYLDADHIYEFDRSDLHQGLKNAGIDPIKSNYIYGVQKLWCKAH